MTEHDSAEPASGPPAAAAPRPWDRAAMLAGSTTALVIASLAGSLLGFLNKAACRSGDWNIYLKQFQAHCYTDIYPLYFQEQLSTGKVPYTGHPVEYPVLIGAAMQAVAWVVKPISDPSLRGREFFDVTVLLLAAFSLAGTLATAYLAGRSRRWTALGVALAPGLILAAFINWDLIAMGLVALGMAAWAARRTVLAGVLLGLAVATKFYPLLFFGPLLLLCLRAGRMRAFWPPRPPPPSPGSRSTCRSRSPRRPAGGGSTGSARAGPRTGDRSGTTSRPSAGRFSARSAWLR